MTKVDVPLSNSLWVIGIMIVGRTYYDQYIGTYYDGAKLTYYTDTLREKPSLINRGKSSDYYQFQLSHSRSKFNIVDNGYSIVLNDKKRLELIESLKNGDTVTLGYPESLDYLTKSNQNEVKAISLAKNNHIIVSTEEVLTADKKHTKKLYLIGLSIITLGFVSLYFRKRKEKNNNIQHFTLPN